MLVEVVGIIMVVEVMETLVVLGMLVDVMMTRDRKFGVGDGGNEVIGGRVGDGNNGVGGESETGVWYAKRSGAGGGCEEKRKR